MDKLQRSCAPAALTPADVVTRTRVLAYHLAAKALRSARAAGPGRGLPDLDELANEGFAALLEALPRFDPCRSRLSTYAYGVFRRVMGLYARACRLGLSPAECHRRDARGATPPRHRGGDAAARLRQPEADGGRRSRAVVERLASGLPRRDRRLVRVYLEEGGGVGAVARRLRVGRDAGEYRLKKLFARIRRQATA